MIHRTDFTLLLLNEKSEIVCRARVSVASLFMLCVDSGGGAGAAVGWIHNVKWNGWTDRHGPAWSFIKPRKLNTTR